MLEAKNIFKTYNGGKTAVLKDVSVRIDDGFTVILGASGSGKSTLLRILSGLEHADSGEVWYNGNDLQQMNDKQLTAFRRKEVGFIFQQYYLLSHLSVEANVKLGAHLANNNDYYDVIEAVGLGDKLRLRPSALSGGEQQRVCIARALAKNPKILFADEPTGALDETTGRKVLEYLLRLQKEKRFTMVMVTHNQNIAEVADTVIGMNSGNIVRISRNAAPKDVYEIGW